MIKLNNDLFGLHCPFFYRVDIIRDTTSTYVANLGDTHVFTVYYTNNADILFSRFLALTKAEILEKDPRVTDNCNGYIQVYLVDGVRGEQLLIYDSSQMYLGSPGINETILTNLEKEVHILNRYIHIPSDCVFVKDEKKTHFFIVSQFTEDDVNFSFLEPLSDDFWHYVFVGFVEAKLRAYAEDQDAKEGVYWMYGTYKSEADEAKDAA